MVEVLQRLYLKQGIVEVVNDIKAWLSGAVPLLFIPDISG
jgi:hypothetical protein